ncbi:hypothetical protein FRC17_004953, partial [Serendipita sp. 399]
MRSYLNVSGTDDAIQRGYILITSILLIGYTAQGASIKLILPGEEGSPSSNPGTHEASPSLSAAIAEATSSLVGESSNVHRRDLALEHPTLSEGGYAALRAATAFFLIAKAIRIALLIFYAISLPRFRAAHLLQAFFTLLPCLVFFRMFFVDSVVGAMGVFILGVFLDILGKYVAGILVHSGSTRKRHQFFIPALEIGHVIDKTAAFFVLVAGEILIAVSYIAEEESEIGAHGEFWRSALGVVIAFLLCWIYFDADSCKVFVHAIRRHWFSSITWTQLHLPLCAGLVIAAAAAHKMILKSKVDQGLRWYFAGGMTAIMVCLGIMGFLHKSLDKPGSGLIPRWIRLSLRIVLGGFFVTFPLYSNESSVMELGVYAAGLGALVCVETVGKIGTVGNLVERSVRMNGDDGGGGTAYLGVDSTSESLLPSLGGYHDEAMKAPVFNVASSKNQLSPQDNQVDHINASFSPTCPSRLPVEILQHVVAFVRDRNDLRRLALTSKAFKSPAELGIYRDIRISTSRKGNSETPIFATYESLVTLFESLKTPRIGKYVASFKMELNYSMICSVCYNRLHSLPEPTARCVCGALEVKLGYAITQLPNLQKLSLHCHLGQQPEAGRTHVGWLASLQSRTLQVLDLACYCSLWEPSDLLLLQVSCWSKLKAIQLNLWTIISSSEEESGSRLPKGVRLPPTIDTVAWSHSHVTILANDLQSWIIANRPMKNVAFTNRNFPCSATGNTLTSALMNTGSQLELLYALNIHLWLPTQEPTPYLHLVSVGSIPVEGSTSKSAILQITGTLSFLKRLRTIEFAFEPGRLLERDIFTNWNQNGLLTKLKMQHPSLMRVYLVGRSYAFSSHTPAFLYEKSE